METNESINAEIKPGDSARAIRKRKKEITKPKPDGSGGHS